MSVTAFTIGLLLFFTGLDKVLEVLNDLLPFWLLWVLVLLGVV
jgi:hypothetical protein